jgi:hypothetical protein
VAVQCSCKGITAVLAFSAAALTHTQKRLGLVWDAAALALNFAVKPTLWTKDPCGNLRWKQSLIRITPSCGHHCTKPLVFHPYKH